MTVSQEPDEANAEGTEAATPDPQEGETPPANLMMDSEQRGGTPPATMMIDTVEFSRHDVEDDSHLLQLSQPDQAGDDT